MFIHLLTAKELLWSLISSADDNSNNANENADKDQYDAYGGDDVHAEEGLTGEWLVIDQPKTVLPWRKCLKLIEYVWLLGDVIIRLFW